MRPILITAALCCLLAGCVTNEQAATPEPSAQPTALQQLTAADHARCAGTGATGREYDHCREMLVSNRVYALQNVPASAR